MHGLWEEREPEENRLGNTQVQVGGGHRKETANLVLAPKRRGKLELGLEDGQESAMQERVQDAGRV